MNAIYIMPYYDSYTKCYKNIITIDSSLQILQNILKQINYKSPTSYTDYSNSCGCSNSCIYAFKSLKNDCELMCENEIPSLFNEMINRGISIDTKITKMMNNHKFNNKKLLCYIKTS